LSDDLLGFSGVKGGNVYGFWQAIVWVFTYRRVVVTLRNGTRIKYLRNSQVSAFDYRVTFQGWLTTAGANGKGNLIKLGDSFNQVVVNSIDIASVEIR
jgi:hypothetical protein